MKLVTTIALAVLVSVLLEVSFFSEIPTFDYSLREHDSNIVATQIKQTKLPFIENQGQINDSVRYYAKTFAGTVYVTDYDLTYYSVKKDSAEALVIKEKFLGNLLQPNGIEKSSSVVSYFKGNQKNWKTDISTFDNVFLGTIWPNIDVKLNAYGNNVEKIFSIHPGGNPSNIRMSFDGISGLSLSQNNNLVIDTDLGAVVLSKPIAYQQIDGKRNNIQVTYDIIDSNTYGFSVLSYDPKYDLVIDPLIASTFVGGSSSDTGWDLVFDDAGNLYAVGTTFDDTTDFPTTAGAYDNTHNGFNDVFVSKFDNTLTSLSTSTFIGGDSDDQGYAIALDSSGNVYITGVTTNGNITDFPTTAGAYNTTHNGSTDAFVAKFNGALTSLLASTFIGGDDSESGEDITLDSSGNVYITGYAMSGNSTTFPTTAGAYDTSYNGGIHDAFVSKFDSTLSSLLASTFIGGDNTDIGFAIATDSSGNVYITGDTTDGTVDFPTTTGAYDNTHNGSTDIFVAKLNGALTSLLASTLIGGDDEDNSGYAIALDSSDNVYISGDTANGNSTIFFPTTAGAYDTSYNGGIHDAFVSKFDSTLSSLLASTFIGGDDKDVGFAISVDSSGNVYITGNTTDGTVDFPTTTGAYNTTHSGVSDVFVSKFNSALSSLLASTFIGGSNSEAGYIVVLDRSSNVYVTGETNSINFPTTTGAYNTTHNGNYDVFISSLDCNLSSSGASCGTVTSGGSVLVPVASGGTAQIETDAGTNLSVTLPAGVSGAINFTDTDSGTSDSTIGFLGSIIDIDPVGGATCASGCTISFTFTGEQAATAGIGPFEAKIYHDSNEDGSFQSSEEIATTITGSDPYTATGTASFTSKFAVGGIRANAVAAAQSLSGGGFFEFLSKCDPDGFASGQSLKVYEISYDKCEANKLQVLAYSTCGPLKAEVTTNSGRYTLGMPSTQPYLNDKEKKIVLGAEISPSLESFNIMIKDKRDHFTDKIILNQCSATKAYLNHNGYTSGQQSPFFYGSFADIETIQDSNQDQIEREKQARIDPEPEIKVVNEKPTELKSTTFKEGQVDPEPEQTTNDNPQVEVDPEPTSNDSEISVIEELLRIFSNVFHMKR